MGEASARVLKAIQPGRDSIDADELDYPDLDKIIKQYRLRTRRLHVYGNALRWPYAIISDEDITDTYLLQIAYRIQKAKLPIEKKFWSKHYTKTSINLYGKPMQAEVATVASLELDYLSDAARIIDRHQDFLSPVIEGYSALASGRNPLALCLEERYKLVLHEVKEYFMANYDEAFACFDDFAPNKLLHPSDVADCFYRALGILARHDSEWKNWSVAHDDSARLSVDVHQKQINVGRYRAPISYNDVKGLFAHEVLVHALRSVNGCKVSQEFAQGLPGYLEAEEGLGVLVESAVNGRVANKVKDRYVDIALALGDDGRKPMTRQQLFGVCYSRAVARGVAEGKDFDLGKLEDYTWEHVNRIYRGTLGNKYVGVFTKDVTYYQGFCKVADYLLRVMAQDKPLEQGLEYLLLGKFDPSDARHAEYAYSQGIKFS